MITIIQEMNKRGYSSIIASILLYEKQIGYDFFNKVYTFKSKE